MTAFLFVVVVVLVLAIFIAGLRKVDGRGAAFRAGLLVAASYLVLPAILALVGALDRYSPPPAPGFILFALLTAGTVALAFSRLGGRLAQLPLAALVGYQAFRVPLEWLLHRLHQEGTIPVQMTFEGRNFDIVTGVSAVVLALWLRKARGPRGIVLAWNVLGLLLLVNIVGLAVLSMPVPFRVFLDGPPNLLPSTFPYVWLPTFLVQAALFGHLLVFRALAAPQRKE